MLSVGKKLGGDFIEYQTDIYETGDRKKSSFSNKPKTSIEAKRFGNLIARIPVDHSMPYNNLICRSCGEIISHEEYFSLYGVYPDGQSFLGSNVTNRQTTSDQSYGHGINYMPVFYGTEQTIQINTNVGESHIETFRDSSGTVYYSTVKDNFHEGDKKPLKQNVLVNLPGNQIDHSKEDKSYDQSYSYVQSNSVCSECQKMIKPNGQTNFKQQAVSKSTESKRTQPDNIIRMNNPEIPEKIIQSGEIQQGNVKITYASPKKYTVFCSSSDSNVCVKYIRSSLLSDDNLGMISSNCIKDEVSVQHFHLWKWLLIAIALFVLFVSMIRRTNGNGDFRDFSFLDDLCTLIHLKNFEPPPCF
ncbi:unnamed protein product [Mytilus coruscus]|uniref:Transmembrane protein n=1 Tax=Mytilus coruscus TaxID=42192 RepID=A0A6J8EQE9_MYTCO|nr:unnamed protein product [Mytilus coruscus]